MDSALHFYRDLFGLEVSSPLELPNKFLKAGGGAYGVPEMIVLVPHPDKSTEFPREKPKRVLHHLAFRIEATEYDGLRDRLIDAGIEVRSGIHPVLEGVRTFYADDHEAAEGGGEAEREEEAAAELGKRGQPGEGRGGPDAKPGHHLSPPLDAGPAPPAEDFLGAVPGHCEADHQTQNNQAETQQH